MTDLEPHKDPDCVDHVASAIADVLGYEGLDGANPLMRQMLRCKARDALKPSQSKEASGD